MSIRVLYSFPHRIGAGRICHTAYQQVDCSARAGAQMKVFATSVARPSGEGVKVTSTLAVGKARVPVKWIGRRIACDWHDRTVARWLDSHWREVDVVHGWPLGSLRTLQVAKRRGIPSVLERPNAHTRFAYEAVAEENRRVGITLPKNHDHEFNEALLLHEEREYRTASYLLCPSEFVERTFIEQGVEKSRLLRSGYGFDHHSFTPDEKRNPDAGLVMIYAGVCEPRKGLHYALEAWRDSGLSATGKFMVCGGFVPGYAERLGRLLEQPGVEVLGHRRDLPELMRKSDVFVLSSVEEGSALVTYEARGSGCVLLVSDACGAVCDDGVDGLVHAARDVSKLTEHLSMLDRDRGLLSSLKRRSLETIPNITWEQAGKKLVECYHIAAESSRKVQV